MHSLSSLLKLIPPIHREGYPFIGAFAVATVVVGWVWEPLFYVGIALTIWCALFFRDPVRITPVSEDLVVSPADGEVSFVGVMQPPAGHEMGSRPMHRISIYMSPFDCHVNRSPVRGKVRRMIYKKGSFHPAELDKASEENERNTLVIDTVHGPVGVVQIAGMMARRIVSWSEEGDQLAPGERIGMIRFGSRVDVYIPSEAVPLVAVGQRMISGETVLASYSGERPIPLTRSS